MDRWRLAFKFLGIRILFHIKFFHRSLIKLCKKSKIFLNIKFKIPIDTLSFDFFTISNKDPSFDTSKSPDDGCYIWGLYLDGCKWNDDIKCIDE